MKLVRKWSYLYNKYDSCFFESYMNGNPRTEPSLAEVLLSFVYIVATVSNYMPMGAEEMPTEEDNG